MLVNRPRIGSYFARDPCSNTDINADPEKAAINPEVVLIDKLLNDIKAKLKLAKISPQAFAEKLTL